MRTVSAQWPVTLRQSHQMITRVSAYYGDVKQADIPIVDGSITYDAFAAGARRCTLTVPLTYEGVSYNPQHDPTAPLAANGQRLLITTGVIHANRDIEDVSQGWYVITDWEVDVDQGVITVTGSDLWELLQRVPILGNDVSLRVPEKVVTTTSGALNRLLYPRLYSQPFPSNSSWPVEAHILEYTMSIAPRIMGPNQAIQLVIGDDRASKLSDLAAAWPAVFRVDDAGELEVRAIPEIPTSATTPDIEITDADGVNPVMVTRSFTAERDKVFNTVVLSARSSSTGEILQTANWQYNAGTWSTQGPLGYRPLVQETTLVASASDLDDMALGLLNRSISYVMTETVECVPNPAIELDDVARISSGGLDFTGRVVGITLPLTPSGPMQLTVTNSDAGTSAASITRGET